MAAQYAQVDVCKILIQQGADLNLRSSSGEVYVTFGFFY
jgi:hypothetical protein